MPIYWYTNIHLYWYTYIYKWFYIYIYIYLFISVLMLFLANITEIPVISVTAELKSLKWDSKWLQVISVLGSLNKRVVYSVYTWLAPAWTDSCSQKKDWSILSGEEPKGNWDRTPLPSNSKFYLVSATIKKKSIDIKWKVAHLTDYLLISQEYSWFLLKKALKSSLFHIQRHRNL